MLSIYAFCGSLISISYSVTQTYTIYSKIYKKNMDLINHHINDAVDFTYQTYIKQLKISNNWNEDTKIQAKDIAIEYFKNLNSSNFFYIDINNIRISRLIEDRIKYIKAENKLI